VEDFLRRKTLTDSLEKIKLDLMQTGIAAMFAEMTESYQSSPSERDNWKPSMDVFQRFSVATSSYTDVDNQVVEILGLDGLMSPEFWQDWMTDHEPGKVFHLQHKIKLALDIAPENSWVTGTRLCQNFSR